MKTALDVARRCLCLELLLQRYVLETETDEPEAAREKARALWLSRDEDLGIRGALTATERGLLESPVGALSEDDLDELHGRASGAAVLVWALGRSDARPTLATLEEVVAEHGLLGDGSISLARKAADGAALRPEAELDDALSAWLRARGKAKDIDDPSRIFAGLAAHHVAWILDSAMAFDDDIG